jgi:hypothetical protein
MSYLFHVDPKSVADDGDELSIQTRLRSRCKMWAPSMRLVATPNAGKRTAWAAMKAKAEGMAKGYPDLNAFWEGGFAVLELKDRNGTLSPEQIDWLNFLHRCGIACGCFRSVDSAVAFLRAQGAPFTVAEAA